MKISRLIRFALASLTAGLLSAQEARLVNISTRGQVGTGANILFGGFVVGGASKTLLVRAIGPGLGAFGVPGTLSDPTLAIVDAGGVVVRSNDNWSAADGTAFSQVGAFPLPANSKDAVILATFPPGAYTAQISGLGTPPTGIAILEVYDVSGGGQLVNIATRLQVGTGLDAAVAGFVVGPGTGARKLLVRGIGPALGAFGLTGFLPDPRIVIVDGNGNTVATALANGGVTALAPATAQAGAFASSAGDAATIVTLAPGSYTVQLAGNSGSTSGVGLIEVYDITNSTGTPANLAGTPRLYFASLRPAAGATASTASGYAAILFDPNTNAATVNVSFSNLTSAQAGAHLVIGDSATGGTFVLNLPRGQVNGLTWNFTPAGVNSTAAIIAALQAGRIFITVDSANFPAGELQGGFVQTSGSQAFAAPAAPPALPAAALTAPTQTDAARFLTQATFGPTSASIAALQARGITGWIDDQMALPATSLVTLTRQDGVDYPRPPSPQGGVFTIQNSDNFNVAWQKLAITAPDQLRHRVAFALSEIFVIGDMGTLNAEIENKSNYWDLLAKHAFGNYRTLLEDVSLIPAMGLWLSHLGNQKANPVTGSVPDENYAREVMQLFSIGLVQLQPDGSLMLDAAGQPIPTYNQDMVAEAAKVFTGWAFAVAPAATTFADFLQYPNFTGETFLPAGNAWISPMRYFDAFHDKTQKRIVSVQQVPLASATPTVVPANQAGPADLKIMLDTLFNHPNTGPFISRQLIQRLVTSNPSAGYVYRIARVFANDGAGTRGNLGAVVRAILTDYEARSPDLLAHVGYGKLREPLLRQTGLFRALNIKAPNGRYFDGYAGNPRAFQGYFDATSLSAPTNSLGQAPLNASSVFNFFAPDFAPPGAMAAAGLVAPEMQIMDSFLSINAPATLMAYLTKARQEPAPPSGLSPYVVPDYTELLPLAATPGSLVDRINLLFCANQMTATTRASILAGLQALPAATTDTEKVKLAVSFTLYSPDGATQR